MRESRLVLARTRRTPLAAALLTLLAVLTSAHEVDAEPEVSAESGYFHALLDPAGARADALVAQGRALLAGAAGELHTLEHTRGPDDVTRANALARCDAALALVPTQRAALYLRGSLLTDDEAAIATLSTLRTLDPLYAAEDVALALARAHERRGDLAQAEAAYTRAIALHSAPSDPQTALAGLAQIAMLRADLGRAVVLFRRALHGEPSLSSARTRLGLAVALDRRGDQSEGLREAGRALREDRTLASAQEIALAAAHEQSYHRGLAWLARVDAERSDHEPPSRTIARALRTLVRLDAPAREALAQGLAAWEQDDELRPLVARLAPKPSERPRLPATPLPSAPQREPAREVRVVLAALEALHAFTRFLHEGGATGPYAEQARDHVAKLSLALAAPAR